MKRIPLTQGKFAIVDDEDYEAITKFKWFASKTTYGGFIAARRSRVNNAWVTIFMHREILGLKKGDKVGTDHINHNTLDNRKPNLRKCTHTQNAYNRSSDRNSSSKYKGVSWYKARKKWDVHITVNRVPMWLGLHETEEAAATTYNIAAKKYHGKFARLNEIT